MGKRGLEQADAVMDARKKNRSTEPQKELEEPRCFLSNLPWSVTEEQVRDFFCGMVTAIEWLSNADGSFKGRAFASFVDNDAAKAAVALSGSEIDSRAVKVELAAPRKKSTFVVAGTEDPGQPSKSVFLVNLGWKIDEASISSHFAECGEVLRVKWLEKDGEFIGKAFVDFGTVSTPVAHAHVDTDGPANVQSMAYGVCRSRQRQRL